MVDHHILTVNGYRYSYRICGHGPELLLLHGWLNSSRLWEGTMRYLSRHFRCVALDLGGFGDSDAGDGPLSVPDQARFVAGFCGATRLRPHSVIGHSMGGAVALLLALDHSHLLDRLVLVCPVVTGKFYNGTRLLISTLLNHRAFAIGERLWPTLQALPVSLSVFSHPHLSREAARRNFEDFRKARWGAAQGGAASMLDIGLERRLGEIDKPTFVIIAGRDETVPPDDGRIAAARIPGAQSVEFAAGHHHIFDEEPIRFNDALTHFLKLDTAGHTHDHT